jgi:hypothetical protein
MPLYRFKHPSDKTWIEIVAETFAEALTKLKELAR